MANAPSKATQQHFLQKLQKDKSSPKDIWEYALSVKWVDHVRQYIEDESCSTKSVPPIFSSEIEGENIYIGENNWKILALWYGLDAQFSCRRRPTVGCYTNILATPGSSDPPQHGYVFADNKLDYLTARCCRLRDVEDKEAKHLWLTFYFWDFVEYVEFQLRCTLKIHPSKAARMWFSLVDDGTCIMLEEISSSKSLSIGCIICRDYPELFELLKKRQTLPSDQSLESSMPSASICTIKEDLSNVFLSQQWQLMLCLEELPSPATDYGDVLGITGGMVPSLFRSLHIDHLFLGTSEHQAWDSALKNIVFEASEEFKKTMQIQQEKILSRGEHLIQQAHLSYKMKADELSSKLEEVTTKEKTLNFREKELNEREHELNCRLDKYKSVLTEFLMRKDAFEKNAQIMAEQNRITGSKIDLNVGGARFTTSLSTLLKEKNSLLHTMFSGQHPLQPDVDGSYFVDRDGTNFRHILNFLRDGPPSMERLNREDFRLLSELRSEAQYYQLSRMADVLSAMMSPARGKAGAFASQPK
ncbi:hypothetical protein C0Q70_10384 [Pomacea canaliculata]|uniref:BTB domain-containing protein n=1 Tax=Pomacea canaliculata TaxID=400727 RepID=A0A2T7PCG3_POMCA|nr:uncharacterized protein LOC112565271 [Pomacea canaliculata]PVD31106.1 hypothetical protein C0Q70_10384 [Pomacea canaliculata]